MSDVLNSLRLKIIMCGEPNVGKTSLIRRFVKDSFYNYEEPTVGFKLASYTSEIDGILVKLEFYDIMGQNCGKFQTSNFYHRACGALLVYDVTSPVTLTKLNEWNQLVDEHAPENIVKILIGNKVDLRPRDDGKPCLSTQDGANWTISNNVAQLIETSAKTAENVHMAFETVAKLCPLYNLARDVKNGLISSDALKDDFIRLDDLFTLKQSADKVMKLKVLIIGDTGTGKTSLLQRISGNPLSDPNELNNVKTTFNVENVEINLDIHDPYCLTLKNSEKNFDSVLCLYDITNTKSLKKLKYITNIATLSSKVKANSIKLLIGNKMDLRKNHAQTSHSFYLTKDHVQQWIKRCNKTNYFNGSFEISAKTGQNVNKVLYILAKSFIKNPKFAKLIKNKGGCCS